MPCKKAQSNEWARNPIKIMQMPHRTHNDFSIGTIVQDFSLHVPVRRFIYSHVKKHFFFKFSVSHHPWWLFTVAYVIESFD
jgi:hypothetical protein